MAGAEVTVYRFRRIDGVDDRSPKHMWGTLQAIARLHRCEPIVHMARKVPASEVDADGFFYDSPDKPTLKTGE